MPSHRQPAATASSSILIHPQPLALSAFVAEHCLDYPASTAYTYLFDNHLTCDSSQPPSHIDHSAARERALLLGAAAVASLLLALLGSAAITAPRACRGRDLHLIRPAAAPPPRRSPAQSGTETTSEQHSLHPALTAAQHPPRPHCRPAPTPPSLPASTHLALTATHPTTHLRAHPTPTCLRRSRSAIACGLAAASRSLCRKVV